MSTTTLPAAWDVDEDGYWVVARGHLTLAEFKQAARPVLLNPADGVNWTDQEPEDQEWFLAEEANRIDRDGVQHAYAVSLRSDDPRRGIQDYVYERTGDGVFEPVTIFGAGNLNGAGGPPAPATVRS